MKRRLSVLLAVVLAVAMILPAGTALAADSYPIKSDTSMIIAMNSSSIATITPVNPALTNSQNIQYSIDTSRSTGYGQVVNTKTSVVYNGLTYTNQPAAQVTGLVSGTLVINASIGGIVLGSTTITVRSILASGSATMRAAYSLLSYGQSTQITSSSGYPIIAATSSDTNFVVTSSGLVTCKLASVGYSDIACYDSAGNYGTVRIFAGSFPTNTVSSTSTNVPVGSTLQLYLSGVPDHCGSSNNAVATVTDTGLVKGVSSGRATIYCINSVAGTYGQFTVTVGSGAGGGTGTSGVTILKSSIAVGESTMLTGASITSATSANPAVASVTANGVVTGVSAGVTAITYITSTGSVGSVSVVVTGASSGVSLLKSTIAVGESTMISGATLSTAYSSDAGVAKVTSNGIVTGVSAGTATITYITTSGITGTLTVTVGAGSTADPNLPAPTKSYTFAAGAYKTFKFTGRNVSKAWTADPTVATASLVRASDGYMQARFTGVNGGTTTAYMQTESGSVSAITVVITGSGASSDIGSDSAVGKTGIISTGDADLRVVCRKGAGSSYGAVATIANGIRVKIVGTSGEYYKVTFSTSTKTYNGYIKAKYISVS